MRPVKETRSGPAGSSRRVSVPTLRVRMHFFACFCLSFGLGRRQWRPCRSPRAERVIAISSLDGADSVKRKLVPSGAFARSAVSFFATRNRLLVRLVPLSGGGGGGGGGGANGTFRVVVVAG